MKVFKAILSLLSVAIIVVFLYSENRLSWSFGGIALLFYLLCSAVHLVAHESGHFIGGAMSGYKLLLLQLGPINIIASKNNSPQILWKWIIGGQCIMLPNHLENVHFKTYNMGGIVANAILMAFSIMLLQLDSFWTSLLFIEFICVGVKKISINAVPHKTNLIPNDGYVIKSLSKNKAVQQDYAFYLRLYGKLFLKEEIVVSDFKYEREITGNENEMMYYNEIQDILSNLETTNRNSKSE